MDRAEVIEILKNMLKIHKHLKTTPQAAALGKGYQDYIDKRIEAMQFAIHSLEVDERLRPAVHGDNTQGGSR